MGVARSTETKAWADSVRVFISWSGEESRAVALALRDWLPVVIQSLDPWCSDTDIEAGANWNSTIGNELSTAKFGIICVTRENQNRPWLNFEAGAISKLVSNAAPVLVDFDSKSDLQAGPISSLQVTMLDREGILRLLVDINRKLDRPLAEQLLRSSFDNGISELEVRLQQARDVPSTTSETPRSEEDKISEILTLTREIVGKLPSAATAAVLPRTVTASIPCRPSTDGQELYTRRVVEAMIWDQLEILEVGLEPLSLTWLDAEEVVISSNEHIDKQRRNVVLALLQRRFPTLKVDFKASVLTGRAAQAVRARHSSEHAE